MKKSLSENLTVGQFAKLHNINKRTLHYYDEVKLFSPVVIGENGYRYYANYQSLEFTIILALRDLGMSVEEIKIKVNDNLWSNNKIVATFKEKISDIEKNIIKLSDVKKMLEEKVDMIDTITNCNLNEVKLVRGERKQLVISKSIDDVNSWQDLTKMLDFAKIFTNSQLFNHIYGWAINTDKVKAGNFVDYDFYFAHLRESDDLVPDKIIEECDYLVGYSVGELENVKAAYQRILQYASEHNYELYDYAYEQGMNEVVVSNLKDYITQISIPCKIV